MAENSLEYFISLIQSRKVFERNNRFQVNIHFWVTADDIELKSLFEWNPDVEPSRFSSGLGHNMYELAVRLRNRGHDISLGTKVPHKASLIVVFKKDFTVSRSNLRVVWHSLRRPVVHIRSDLQLDLLPLFEPDLEVMPNNTLVKKQFQKFISPLPQRGLIPSRRNLQDRLVNICVKSNPQTFPDYLFEVASEAKMNQSTKDLVFIWDMPSFSDGADNNWHDFSNVDVTLVLRRRNIYGHDDQRKPPTRLLNAWLAGTIPFIDPIEAYLELATDRVDAIVITHPSEILTRITELNDDPTYRKTISDNIMKQSINLKKYDALNNWEKELNSVITSSKIGIYRTLTITCTSAINLVKNFIRHRLPSPQSESLNAQPVN